MNNRLERACANPFGVTHDRSGPTPLLWSCTVERIDGSFERIAVWSTMTVVLSAEAAPAAAP